MTVHGQPVLNLMYRFRPLTWGQGYATEAAGAVVTWSEQNLPGQVVVARVRPEHLASQRRPPPRLHPRPVSYTHLTLPTSDLV